MVPMEPAEILRPGPSAKRDWCGKSDAIRRVPLQGTVMNRLLETSSDSEPLTRFVSGERLFFHSARRP